MGNAAHWSGLGDWRGMALAVALGLLIGIQRGWASRQQAPGTRFAGIRTFGLLGLAGGLAGALFAKAPAVAVIVLAAGAGLVIIGYVRMTRGPAPVSGTTSIVGLLTLTCGFLAASGEPLVATVSAVSILLLLAMRTPLHRFVGALSEEEVTAIARFALIALVIMPLLPDRAYGPYDAWNPRQLWLVVVLVSGFSLAGYLASRLLGPSRAMLAMAVAGSLVSSTAVTAAMATRLREGAVSAKLLHAAIAVASAVMFVRVMVLAALLAPFALPTFARLAVPGMLVSLAACAWLMWRGRGDAVRAGDVVQVKNPFALRPALLLMVLVMVLSVAARWVLARYGDSGVAAVLAISGSVDVDSAVITMGNLPPGTLAPRTAGLVLLVPVVLNTLFKAFVAFGIAGWRRVWPSAAILAASALAALAGVPFVAQ